ncbi:MAG: uracil-DNA glycosylase [Bacteroidota bacterium]
MQVQIGTSWAQHLAPEFDKLYFQDLVAFVKEEYQHHTIYPPGGAIFKAFDLCSLDATQVVIIGQDPYHGPRQANGLCFSVGNQVPIPPSLANIFTEIYHDVGSALPTHGNLTRWAQQGILLLNATLTVRAGKPGSHQNKGWETFTDRVIGTVSHLKEHVVFLLWGAYAQKKTALIDAQKHLILQSAHPSPYAAHKGFFGNRHFSKANAYLQAHGRAPIAW